MSNHLDLQLLPRIKLASLHPLKCKVSNVEEKLCPVMLEKSAFNYANTMKTCN